MTEIEKDTEDVLVQVVLKPKKGQGRRQIIQGKRALAIIEALDILNEREVLEKNPPKGFSLVQSLALAISLGYDTPDKIADCLEREIQRCSA